MAISSPTQKDDYPVSDENFDLLSVIYHASKELKALDTYIVDAEEAGDMHLSEFLSQVREQDRDRVARAKRLLSERIGLQKSGK